MNICGFVQRAFKININLLNFTTALRERLGGCRYANFAVKEIKTNKMGMGVGVK